VDGLVNGPTNPRVDGLTDQPGHKTVKEPFGSMLSEVPHAEAENRLIETVKTDLGTDDLEGLGHRDGHDTGHEGRDEG
jgi:hypothetical protein